MKLSLTLLVAAVATSGAVATGISDECSQLWTLKEEPVCASNGRTYNNKCEVEFDRLKKNDTSLVVVSNGNCTAVSGNALSSTDSANGSTVAPKSDAYQTKSALWAVAATSAVVWTVAAMA